MTSSDQPRGYVGLDVELGASDQWNLAPLNLRGDIVRQRPGFLDGQDLSGALDRPKPTQAVAECLELRVGHGRHQAKQIVGPELVGDQHPVCIGNHGRDHGYWIVVIDPTNDFICVVLGDLWQFDLGHDQGRSVAMRHRHIGGESFAASRPILREIDEVKAGAKDQCIGPVICDPLRDNPQAMSQSIRFSHTLTVSPTNPLPSGPIQTYPGWNLRSLS